MTEAQLFEMYGRAQAALELVKADYAKLVEVMRGVAKGEIEPSRLAVNPDGTWALGPKAE